MHNHHQRHEIIAEVHTRPFQDLPAPLSLLHIAVLYDGNDSSTAELDVLRMARTMGFEFNRDHRGFLFCRQADRALRYEPHNEFYSLTLYQFNSLEPLSLPLGWTESLPGALLTGAEVLFRKQTGSMGDWAIRHLGKCPQPSSSVMSDSAIICTDFQPQPTSSFVRVLVEDISLRPAQAGRLLQRICEIETYRHIALLSMPLARSLMPKINDLDQKLASVSQRTLDQDVSEVLAQMMALAAAVEALSASTANRFSASEAYFALVERSIQELRENRVEGAQMVEEFMDRRLDPARRTIRSAAARIEMLSKRIARATELIQSQVNLAIEQQNKALLEALNSRAHRQMRLQAKLESLSVIVVAYYMYDLIDLALKNLLPEGQLLGLLLTGTTLSLPLIMLLLYWIVRGMMKGVSED